MDDDALAHLLEVQSGVVARRQVLACGGDDNDIERLIRRRVWRRVLDGVYVDHTGPLNWAQRAWVAVLHHWPAALVGQSALDAWGVRRRSGLRSVDEVIHVGIDASRSVGAVEGIRVRRQRGFSGHVLWNLSPPRVGLERAMIEVAGQAPDEAAAVAVLADGCQARRTTASRLLETLQSMPRCPRRGLLRRILDDVASGVFSVMERLYLTDVERRHGLPTGRRQRVVRQGRTTAHRDVDHVEWGVVIELDGRLGHEWAADRWQDLDRDVATAVNDEVTVRVGWKQVLDPCRLAAAVARILIARGWPGRPRACRPGCAVEALCADLPASGAGRSAQ